MDGRGVGGDEEGGFAAADCKCVNASLVCIVHAVQPRCPQKERREETPHARQNTPAEI